MTTSRQTGCGCTVKPKQPYIEQECKLIPEYDPGCHECGGKNTYSKKECVYVCRDGVMDIYSSLEDDNEDEPVKGSRKDKPTWVFRNTCDAFAPAPVVEGVGVTPTVNDETGQVTYTITQGDDTDTDTVCETTIEQTDAGLVFSKVCKDIITDEEISNVELYTIPTAAMDLFGKLEPDADNPGQLVWTPAGDGDSQCVYNCNYIDELKCMATHWQHPANNGEKVLDHHYATIPGDYSDATQWASGGVSSATVVKEFEIKKADLVAAGMPKCLNTLYLSTRASSQIQDQNEDQGDTTLSIHTISAAGAVTRTVGNSIYPADNPENDDDYVRDGSREVLEVPFDADGCIKLTHTITQARTAPDGGSFLRAVVKIYGASYSA